jgi:hypothetical protein
MMSLNETLLKKLKKTYEPLTTVRLRFRGKDVAFNTDTEGNAVQLFIGQLKENGNIKGERYSRKMVKDRDGKLLRDHWDRKGTSS